MVPALPSDGADLEWIAEQFDAARLRQWMDEFEENPELTVWLPRFEVEWQASLLEPLEAMGMHSAFDPNSADFSGMFGTGGAYINELLQKTFLRVDEKGTEAAAVTVVGSDLVGSVMDAIVFDRPFFLAIWDHATETVLFLGQTMDPAA